MIYKISDLPAGKRVGPPGDVIRSPRKAVDRFIRLGMGRREPRPWPRQVGIKAAHAAIAHNLHISSRRFGNSPIDIEPQAEKIWTSASPETNNPPPDILNSNTSQEARWYLGNQDVCCFMHFSLNKTSEYPGAEDQRVGQLEDRSIFRASKQGSA